MSRFYPRKTDAEEIYEMTLYLNDEEYDRLNWFVKKTGFNCSKSAAYVIKRTDTC